MVFFRLLFGMLLLAGLLCFAAYVATGNPLWRRRGLVIVKWTVLAGLGFFGVIILERMVLLF